MKKRWKHGFSLLIAAVLLAGLSIGAQAADSTVTFRDSGQVVLGPGSSYGETDLFDGFKNVMPGDSLAQNITIKNNVTQYSYLRVYLRALPHDGSGNPISEDVLSELLSDSRRGTDTELAYMADFLSQLTMTVYNGANVIFQGAPGTGGGLTTNALLGTLSYGESLTLRVELKVPIELDNKYAGRVGEVDWVFTAEGFTDTQITVYKRWSDNGRDRPTSVTATLYNGRTPVESVQLGAWNNWSHTWSDLREGGDWHVYESDVPSGYTVSYLVKGDSVTITNTRSLLPTGQLQWPIPVLAGLGVVLIGYGVLTARKKRKNEKAR